MKNSLYVLTQMEVDITFLAKVIGENNIADSFLVASQARRKAINSIFWNEKMGQWLDYWLGNNTTSKVLLCPSNY